MSNRKPSLPFEITRLKKSIVIPLIFDPKAFLKIVVFIFFLIVGFLTKSTNPASSLILVNISNFSFIYRFINQNVVLL